MERKCEWTKKEKGFEVVFRGNCHGFFQYAEDGGNNAGVEAIFEHRDGKIEMVRPVDIKLLPPDKEIEPACSNAENDW